MLRYQHSLVIDLSQIGSCLFVVRLSRYLT